MQQQHNIRGKPFVHQSEKQMEEVDHNKKLSLSFRVVGISENSTIDQIKNARCVVAKKLFQADPSGSKLVAVDFAYKMAMQSRSDLQKKQHTYCLGVESDGIESTFEAGVLLPCFNEPRNAQRGLCVRCLL